MGCFSILRFCGSDSKGKQQNNWREEEEEEHIWVPAKKKPSCGSSVSGLSSSQSQSHQPPPSPSGQLGGKTLSEVEHEQSKHAVAVAIATAAAAEAAVAAARAAAQIVRLTGNSSSFHQAEASRQEYAATKIQSAFRGYLARKALRALKGLVKLQALIRGRSVRRKAEETLKSMQALQRIQSDACFRRSRLSDGRRASHESVDVKRQLHSWKPVLEMKGDKGWNSSRLSKEEIEMILLSRKEAAFKRERAKEYALDQQEGRNGRASISTSAVVRGHHVGSAEWNWVERWIETQIYKQAQSSSMSSIDHNSLSDKQIIEAKAYIESIDKEEVQSKPSFMEHPPIKDPRRSQSPVPRPRKSVQRSPSRDDESFASSTASLPNFMVQTESAKAKAKARSSSTPKQRTGSVGRTSNQKSFTKAMYAAIGSDAGVPKLRRSPSSQTKNLRPSLDKIKSASFKDLPVDSEQSQESWDRRNFLR